MLEYIKDVGYKTLKGKGRKKIISLVKCSYCYKEKTIIKDTIKRVLTCGCFKDNIVKKNKERATHNMSETRIYNIWRKMIYRCCNKNTKSYRDYGGRGIKVCDEWEELENFLEDMEDKYYRHVDRYGEKDTTLERVGNNEGYNIRNCKWATRKEQNNNQRRRKDQRKFCVEEKDTRIKKFFYNQTKCCIDMKFKTYNLNRWLKGSKPRNNYLIYYCG